MKVDIEKSRWLHDSHFKESKPKRSVPDPTKWRPPGVRAHLALRKRRETEANRQASEVKRINP
jgi:hypothetical protein